MDEFIIPGRWYGIIGKDKESPRALIYDIFREYETYSALVGALNLRIFFWRIMTYYKDRNQEIFLITLENL